VLALLSIFCVPGALRASDRDGKPNVLVVITDDQGYADLGVHGNPQVRTPQMDAFAREAVELTQFYACPVCAPSRAALMTGRYPLRTGIVDVFEPACNMRPEEVTLAEALRDAGYATGLVGKWHLGNKHPRRPTDQGFSEALTMPAIGLWNYFNPRLWHNGQEVTIPGYCMDILADRAITFLRENKDRPFFLYFAPNLIHTPLQIDDAKVAPFRAAGLDEPTAKVYAMLESVDDNFGRVLAALRDLGLEENTLVLFTTDNGPCTGSTTTQRYMAGLRGLKGTVYENGIRVPCFVRWPGRLQGGVKIDRIAALIDVMPTVLDACGVDPPEGVRLDGASLMPLLRNPQAAWPDRTLFFQWEGNPLPEHGRAFAVRDQRYKLVQAVGIADRQSHIRDKYAELCRAQGRGTLTVVGTPRLELFDIEADPGETADLAAEHPKIVAKMKQQYDAWFADVWPAGSESRIPTDEVTRKSDSIR
jgi:arylsulfatase/arylsulfatase A